MKIINYCSFLLLTIILIVACAKKETERSMVWEEDKMVNILFDLRLMDNQIKKHHVLDRDSVSNTYIELIYTIHNITEEDLTYHLEIIQKDAKLAKSLEDKVLKKMVEQKKSFDKDDEYK